MTRRFPTEAEYVRAVEDMLLPDEALECVTVADEIADSSLDSPQALAVTSDRLMAVLYSSDDKSWQQWSLRSLPFRSIVGLDLEARSETRGGQPKSVSTLTVHLSPAGTGQWRLRMRLADAHAARTLHDRILVHLHAPA